MKIKYTLVSFFSAWILTLLLLSPGKISGQTHITKWQDGKNGCVTLTYDDGSINQFRIAAPLMKERGFCATFFINTGNISGSKYLPTFIGRPIEEIIDESKNIPTNEENIFERNSMLRYLALTGKYPEVKNYSDIEVGGKYEEGKLEVAFNIIDNSLDKLRKSRRKYIVESLPLEVGKNYNVTWNELRALAEQGNEIANHTISHPYMTVMDEANIIYEVEKCRDDILDNIGIEHTFSIECPYGISDDRVMELMLQKFPFVRNRLNDDFMKEILRGDPQSPGSSDKEYVQWQRGPLSNTPVKEMKQWIDVTENDSLWLLLVFHGVEGIGWEALPTEIFIEYFDYISSNRDDLWIATFKDAFKYIRERMNTKVEYESDNTSINIKLTNNLDPKIYNMPLTLRTVVPVSWASAHVEQGGLVKTLDVQRENDIAFVQYRALPNNSRIIITRSK